MEDAYCRQARQADTSLDIVYVLTLSSLVFKEFKCLSGLSNIKLFLDLCLSESSLGVFSLRENFSITYINKQISTNLI